MVLRIRVHYVLGGILYTTAVAIRRPRMSLKVTLHIRSGNIRLERYAHRPAKTGIRLECTIRISTGRL